METEDCDLKPRPFFFLLDLIALSVNGDAVDRPLWIPSILITYDGTNLILAEGAATELHRYLMPACMA